MVHSPSSSPALNEIAKTPRCRAHSSGTCTHCQGNFGHHSISSLFWAPKLCMYEVIHPTLQGLIEKCTSLISWFCTQLFSSYPAFFNNAENITIHGGKFNQYNGAVVNNTNIIMNAASYFDKLQDHVSTSAFHGSSLRINHSACYPNTRKQVLGTLFNWVFQTPASQILWLHGAAGAGKTSICHSVADFCGKEKIPVATFFFCHADSTRNSIKTVVATIAYQIVQLVPSTKDLITHAIDSNPLIFCQSFEFQLEKLIIEPLTTLYGTIPEVSRKLLLIFDGLDKCSQTKLEDQVLFINAITEYLALKNVPLKVIISSRKECHLTMAFNSLNVGSLYSEISLDSQYCAKKDIHYFLEESFKEIKQSHPLGHLIPNGWPNPEIIDYIDNKSSGQFVYASTVLKFVSSSYSYPPDRLNALLSNQSIQCSTFSELDSMYQNIFKNIEDLSLVKSILSFVLEHHSSPESISSKLNISISSIYVALAGLSSIVECKSDGIKILHNSLPDFLLDKSRSGVYCIKASLNCL